MKLLTFLILSLAACGDSTVDPPPGDAGVDATRDGNNGQMDAESDAGGDTGEQGDVPEDGERDVVDADDTGAPDGGDTDDADHTDTADAPDVHDAGEDAEVGQDTPEDAPDPAYDPAAPGPHEVETSDDSLTRDGRSIPLAVHAPAGQQGRPWLILLPGFQLQSSRYIPLADHLASHGYVVVRADPPGGLFDVSHTAMADDVSAVIDWATETLGNAIEAESVTVAGHSLGGKVSFMVAHRDPRVAAVFGIDPVNAANPISGYSPTLPDIVPGEIENLDIPVGIAGELLDATADFGPACAPDGMNYVTFTDAATSSPWVAEWTFEGADHMDFVYDKSGCGFVCNACRDGDADEALVHAGLQTLAVAFLRLHFDGDDSMNTYLSGERLPAGVQQR